jgi:TonB family protein
MAGEVARALLWFNPLVWLACRQLGREAEHACDDIVLAGGVPARDYAADLVAVARLCRPSHRRPAPTLSMANPSMLERRIAAMLNPQLDRSLPSRRLVAACGGVLLALTLAIAAVAAQQAAPSTLSGILYDQTGAVLPGVAVTLEDATQAKLTATSSAAGRVDFPNVAPGRYVLSAGLPGFKSFRQEFELREGRDWDRVITLQLGELSESISVRETRMTAPPAPQPQMPVPVRVGGNIRVPKKLVDVKPIYPVTMRAAGREAVVKIDAVIGKDGSVSFARVLNADIHPDFAIAAVDAVRQWKFSPTLLNGVPVDVAMVVSVAFNLGD